MRLIYNNDLPYYSQQESYYCGAASTQMVLDYYIENFNPSVTTQDVIWNAIADDDAPIGRLIAVINQYLASETTRQERYTWIEMKPQTVDYYWSVILDNARHGYPVIIQLNITDTDYFWDDTPGHYVVIRGVYYDNITNEQMIIINDPNDNPNDPDDSNNLYIIPLSVIWEYTQAHTWGFIACI